jgi:hypothetical protein
MHGYSRHKEMPGNINRWAWVGGKKLWGRFHGHELTAMPEPMTPKLKTVIPAKAGIHADCPK